jgi:hypothetical protein
MLETYATIGTYDEIAAKLRARYAAVASHLEFAIPVTGEADRTQLRELVESLRQ